MEWNPEKLENYQKNLRCIQEVVNQLLGCMKGHGWSFRQEITDKNGDFSQEKLCGLVEELISFWSAMVRNSTDYDPAIGKSLAEPYLQARQELYGLYLYLVMRCSLESRAYTQARGGMVKEQPNFTFLLEQAMRLSQSWCVIAKPDGSKHNALFQGYDGHFGLHLYHHLADPESKSDDIALTPWWDSPMERPDLLTDEGNMKRISLKRLTYALLIEDATDAALPEETEQPDADCEDCFDSDGYDSYDQGWDILTEYEDGTSLPDDLDQLSGTEDWATNLALGFVCREEYLSACERFTALFGRAKPEVLRDFYQDIEEIVDLYLAKREIAPLADTDKTMDVYSRIYDGALRQAWRYARGIQWKNL